MRTNADQRKMRLLPDLSEPEAVVTEVSAASPLTFLRSVYADPNQPMNRRMRAAIAALPFEHPKLAVIASLDAGPGFAARLEAAIARSGRMIEGLAQSANSGVTDSVASGDVG